MHIHSYILRAMLFIVSTMGVIASIIIILYVLSTNAFTAQLLPSSARLSGASATYTPSTGADLHYRFSVDGILNETGSMDESSSPYFWLNSGGELHLENGVGKTVQGDLSAGNVWRLLYNANNALDTDDGYYPQNLFRLVTKGMWNNTEQSIRFKITQLNMTDTPNRDGYSGVLLMSRYQDGNNLYYAGIRMDGDAVIKKKHNGSYTTLAQEDLFGSDAGYNKNTNPNMIPGNTWMGLKSVVYTDSSGDVRVEVWLDRNDNGNWEQIASAVDTSQTIDGPAHAGIRTDYLDVHFDDYKVNER